MAYFPPSGSVLTYQTIPSSNLGGASIFGQLPAGTAPIGSVAALQGTNPWVMVGSVQGFPTNQNVSGSVVAFQGGAWTPSVSGTVGASLIGLGPVRISDGTDLLDIYEENQIDTSVVGLAMMFRSNANTSLISVVSPTTPLPVSVQGTVNIGTQSGSVVAFEGAGWSGSVAAFKAGTWITSLVSTVPSSVIVGSSIFGQLPGGTATIGSIATVQGTNPWIITGSIQGGGAGTEYAENVVTPSVTGTAIMFKSNMTTSIMSVVTPATPLPASVQGNVGITNTNLNVGGSVVAFQGAGWSGSVAATVTNTNINVSGSVAAFKLGTWVTSLVSTVPSSVIVGSSIFGQLPAGTAPLGSVATLQGTNPWNIAGSVAAFQAGTQITSISGIPQTSIHGAVTFIAASIVSGHGSVNGAASVQILAAPGAGLYNYVTDFLLSNTGAATTLVTFTDGDTSIIGKSIAPTAGGAIATSISTPMKTLQTNKVVNIVAATATSVLHAWLGGYKAP